MFYDTVNYAFIKSKSGFNCRFSILFETFRKDFFWQVENYDNVGLETEPIHSGAVSEEIYNQYDIGGIY